jgi:type I restriction enzyme S subunit
MFHKETDFKEEPLIGKIPRDWQVAGLKDVADYINGYPFSPDDWKTVGLPIISIQNLNDPTADFNYFEGNIDDRYIIENGNLLFSWSASIGAYIWNRGKAVLNQHIFKVVPNDKVDKMYLFHALFVAIEQLKRKVHGSTMKHFKKTELQTKIPLPSLFEQKQIAEVLGVVDLAVAKTCEVIAKTERLKKGLMQELLTKGIGHKEYKQTPIGKIPKNWEFVRIKELGELQYGYTTSAAQENTGIKFLRITDIKEDGSVNWEQVPYCHIGGNEFDKYALREGDLLFARIGATAGKTTYIGQKVRGIFASYLIRLKTIKKHVHPPFVFYFTQSATYWSQALRQREGQLKKGINATMLSKFMVPLPSFEEQQRIAEILSAVDHKLKLERKEKTKLERVKRGLMDLLLTGKVRVKV